MKVLIIRSAVVYTQASAGILSLIIVSIILFPSNLFSQSLGLNNATPAASSILDMTATNRGVLIPRMTTVQRTAIAAPADGLLVYDLDFDGFYYYDATAVAAWRPLLAGSKSTSTLGGWSTLGNAGTVAATNFLGTTDAIDFRMRTTNIERMTILAGGNVGIGTTAPGYKLDVQGGSLNVGTLYGTSVMRGTLGSFDTRATNPWPETYNMGVTSEFKGNTSNGLIDGGAFNSVLSIRQWAAATDWTGGGVHQLGLTQNGNLWLRYSQTTGAWGAWSKLLSSGSGWTTAGNTLTGTLPASPNEWIGTVNASDWIIRTNNTERFRVQSGGNIGIGTTAPGTKLSVNGNVAIGNIINPRSSLQITKHTGGLAGGSATINRSNAYLMLGGDESTAGQAHIIGFGYINSDIGGTGTFMPAYIGYVNTNTASYEIGALVFGTRSTTTDVVPTEVMRITAAGNVDIGTTTDDSKLNVAGTVKLGTSGTVFTYISNTTVGKDLPSIAAGGTSVETFAVTTASTTTSTVIVSPENALTAGLIIQYARVSAANTVEVTFWNASAGAIDMASMNFYITVLKY